MVPFSNLGVTPLPSLCLLPTLTDPQSAVRLVAIVLLLLREGKLRQLQSDRHPAGSRQVEADREHAANT
jgi:hypothetical protein